MKGVFNLHRVKLLLKTLTVSLQVRSDEPWKTDKNTLAFFKLDIHLKKQLWNYQIMVECFKSGAHLL